MVCVLCVRVFFLPRSLFVPFGNCCWARCPFYSAFAFIWTSAHLNFILTQFSNQLLWHGPRSFQSAHNEQWPYSRCANDILNHGRLMNTINFGMSANESCPHNEDDTAWRWMFSRIWGRILCRRQTWTADSYPPFYYSRNCGCQQSDHLMINARYSIQRLLATDKQNARFPNTVRVFRTCGDAWTNYILAGDNDRLICEKFVTFAVFAMVGVRGCDDKCL